MKGKNYFHNPMVQVRLWHPQKENLTFPSSVCAASTHNDVTSALNNDNDDDDDDNSAVASAKHNCWLLFLLAPSAANLKSSTTTTATAAAVKYYQELKVSCTKLKLKFSFPFVQTFPGGESLELLHKYTGLQFSAASNQPTTTDRQPVPCLVQPFPNQPSRTTHIHTVL